MDLKKITKKLLFPPVWLILVLSAISAAGLAAIFLKHLEQTVLAYVLYGMAFYTLTVLICFFAVVLPKQYGSIREKIYKNPFGRRYLTDRIFRTKISLYVALGVNLLYVSVHLWSWHLSRSWWFIVLALYYAIMAVMRFLLVRYVRLNEIGSSMLREWKRARVCAYILLLINLSLSGAVLMILYQNRGYDYPGMLIYVMALYTFYSTVHAIVETVKHRALGSPVMTTAKIVSLSAALVSMLNLESAMLAQFGIDMPQQEKNLLIILTGALISTVIIALSVILIINATIQIRREKYGK